VVVNSFVEVSVRARVIITSNFFWDLENGGMAQYLGILENDT
jgi:hypothetical protein